MSSGNTNRANLPAAILVFAFLMIWQMAALGMDAAYILPSPIQVVQKLWDLRGPLCGACIRVLIGMLAGCSIQICCSRS